MQKQHVCLEMQKTQMKKLETILMVSLMRLVENAHEVGLILAWLLYKKKKKEWRSRFCLLLTHSTCLYIHTSAVLLKWTVNKTYSQLWHVILMFWLRPLVVLKPHNNKVASYTKLSSVYSKIRYEGLFLILWLLQNHCSFTWLWPIFRYIWVRYIEIRASPWFFSKHFSCRIADRWHWWLQNTDRHDEDFNPTTGTFLRL